MLTRRFVSSVSLLALTFVVGVPAPATASPDAPTPDEVCALLTVAEASALIGKPAKVRPGSSGIGSSSCIWADGGSGGIQVMIETDALLKASATTADQTAVRRFTQIVDLIEKGKAKAVPGVGDKGVWSTEFHMLYVLKGKKVAIVSILKQISPTDDLPRAKKVAAKIVAKL